MHYYQHHIGDFIKETAKLTDSQTIAYLRLLWIYYETEKPLPDDIAVLAMKTGSDEQTVSLILRAFFTEQNRMWIQTRCESEIRKYQKKSASAKNANICRWSNSDVKSDMESDVKSEMKSHPNQEPITNNHNNSVSKDTDGKPSAEEIIWSHGVPLLEKAGISDRNARSFLGKLVKEHGAEKVVDALRAAYKEKPLQPLEWLAAALPTKGKTSKHSGFSERDYGKGGAL